MKTVDGGRWIVSPHNFGESACSILPTENDVNWLDGRLAF